jgi:hypothetical protein
MSLASTHQFLSFFANFFYLHPVSTIMPNRYNLSGAQANSIPQRSASLPTSMQYADIQPTCLSGWAQGRFSFRQQG